MGILPRNLKLAVATILATNTLEPTLKRIRKNTNVFSAEEIEDQVSFAVLIDHNFKKRDGFIPRRVITLINAKITG